jgi:hypothetical protein
MRFLRPRAVWLLVLALFAFAPLAPAQDAGDYDANVRQPAGAIIVPGQFLRRWDPVTIFFIHDMGAAQGTPEDHPEKFVTMNPAQPGAWTWLDARTLQFRPSVPWPPLSQFTWTIKQGSGAQTVQLSRLLSRFRLIDQRLDF